MKARSNLSGAPLTRRSSSKRGAALMAVTLFLGVVLSSALLSLTDAKARQDRVALQKHRLNAWQSAELGLQVTMSKLSTGRSGNVDGLTASVLEAPVSDWTPGTDATGEFSLFTELAETQLVDRDQNGLPDFVDAPTLTEQRLAMVKEPDGTFKVRVSQIGEELFRSMAVGIDGGQVRVFEAILQPRFKNDLLEAGIGLYAGKILSGSDSAYVDSYKSSQGYLASRSDNVLIGSNETVTISDSTFVVNGQIGSALGPDGVTVPTSLEDQVFPEKLPEYEMPVREWTVPTTDSNSEFPAFQAGISPSGGYTLGSSEPTDVASAVTVGRDGESHALVVGDTRIQSTLVIKGHVDLYVDKLTINAGAMIYIAPGASIHLYSAGSVSINGHGFVNSTARPQNLQLYSSGGTISMNGSATFVGLTYAPESSIKVTGSLEYFGALYGAVLDAAGSLDFHFDEDLGGKIGLETRRDPVYRVAGFLELR